LFLFLLLNFEKHIMSKKSVVVAHFQRVDRENYTTSLFAGSRDSLYGKILHWPQKFFVLSFNMPLRKQKAYHGGVVHTLKLRFLMAAVHHLAGRYHQVPFPMERMG
jgi:hypothetical protein